MSIDTISRPSLHSNEHQLASNNWQHGEVELLCVEKWQETHDVFSYRFQGIEPVKFQFKPGQFLTFNMDIDGKKTYRSYTISSSPSRPYSIVVTVKCIEGGRVSNYFAQSLNVGDTINASGPDGVFNLVDIKADKYLFLSAGSGITPMFSMSRWLTDTQVGADIAFLNCAKSPEDLIFRTELDTIRFNNSAFNLSYILESGADQLPLGLSCGEGRINAEQLTRLVQDYKERTIFVCGPEAFMKGVESLLESLNFDMNRYHDESFGTESFEVGETTISEVENTESDFMLRIGDIARAMGQNETLLEGIEAEGLPIIAACRAGVCGACKCRVIEGKTESISEITLTPDEIAQGYVLACSTKLKSDVLLQL
ncbi:flavodoxin reductase family protein [Shewanella psychrophila]|uniref:Flavodoxin reductase family protein n=1 Tax=Shewanella psychrophila TaxID=225848 RepID=A0A1S6HPY7_9GAMM|nr:hybrid-cluster NAD(P)-dependent oxidoreductase [Shewanella psychrophila]AQS37571.1 flavodoxin reductase family protein [Shewanella psychrophila]